MTKFKDIIFKPNVAIHCPDEWMANELLEYADSKGHEWSSGHKYTYDNGWNIYKRDTIYIIKRGTYSGIELAEEKIYKVLHYDDVVIKEGELMETKLKYEMFIKGRRAIIGSKFFYKGETEAIIESIEIDDNSWSITFIANSSLGSIIENEIKEMFFWKKQTIYQLPDTEGNLSEVKVGQLVYTTSHTEGNIIKLFDGKIRVDLGDGLIPDYDNITGKNKIFCPITTNKPSRFIGKQDWSQAPEKAVCWGITSNGYAYWYYKIPIKSTTSDWWQATTSSYISAGYRNDLIDDREKIEVTDWKESLVMRPKEK